MVCQVTPSKEICWNCFCLGAPNCKATFYSLAVLTICELLSNSGYEIPVPILLFIYYLNASKRSNEGNEDYYRWMGLKNYMKDFGRMSENELPEIVLWEKYL